jgi:polysaccharide biosynthesis protein PslH
VTLVEHERIAGGVERRSSDEPQRPRLLFAARRPPFPLVTGARIRTHRLLTGLAQAFETTFVTFEHDERSPDGHVDVEEFRGQLPGIEVVTVSGCRPGKRLRQLFSLVSARSWEYGRYQRQEMVDLLARLVAERRPQVIHFDDLGVAQFGPLGDSINVYSAHNVEYRILDGTASSSRGPRRQFARVERRKVEKIERRVWQTMTLCLACSDHDAAEMSSGGADVIVSPNGADPVTPLAVPTRQPNEPLRLLFVGAVNYRPNQLGLEWFISEVLPRVRERLPAGVVVDVVGSSPRRLAGAEQVTLHGRVPSVEPFYKRAHVAIVPVLYGSGTRLKVIEAMAHQRPVVATAAGAEGLPIVAGSDYFQADEPEDFAAGLVEHAGLCERAGNGDGGELERLLAGARRAIEPLLWPRIVRELSARYLAVAAEQSAKTS